MRSFNRLCVFLLSFGFVLSCLQTTFAQTAADTQIKNIATVSFSDGVTNYSNASNEVVVTVGKVAGLTITPDGQTNSSVTPGQTGVTAVFRVTNVGNFTDDVRFLANGASIRVTGGATITSATVGSGATNILTNPAVVAQTLAQNGYVDVTVTLSINSTAVSGNTIQVFLGDATTGTNFDNVAADNSTNEVNTLSTGASNGSREARGDISFPVTAADLTISKTHSGSFTVNSNGTYTFTATNIGTLPTSGTITVTDTLPVGITVNLGRAGSVVTGGTNAANWTCTSAAGSPQVITCTSSTAISNVSGSNNSVFSLTVGVGPNTAASVTNNVAISGGNEPTGSTANNTGSDPTSVTGQGTPNTVSCPWDGNVWYETALNTNALYTYNVFTGVSTLITSLDRTYYDIAWGADGFLYGVPSGQNPTTLYRIDKTTGIGTPIISSSLFPNTVGLGSDQYGWLYIVSSTTTTSYPVIRRYNIYTNVLEDWIDVSSYGYGATKYAGDLVISAGYAYISTGNTPKDMLKIGPLGAGNSASGASVVTVGYTTTANGMAVGNNGQAFLVNTGNLIYTWNPSDPGLSQAYLGVLAAPGGQVFGAATTVEASGGCSGALAPSFDFGDAPDSYKTTLASNGPRHLATRFLRLGAGAVDAESDGQPSVNADGDDLNDIRGGGNDEMGVASFPSLSVTNTSYSLNVVTSNNFTDFKTGVNTTANLYAWIDFNRDGIFETEEATTMPIPYTPGSPPTYVLNWATISGLVAGKTYARFRITFDNLVNTNGIGQPDTRAFGVANSGEVEDYTLTIAGRPDIALVKSCPLPANCTTSPQMPGTDLTYQIEFTNSGSAAAANLQLIDRIPDFTDYKIGSAAASVATTGLTFTIEYSGDFDPLNPSAATWTYTPVSGGGGASAGYDRLVKAIRWRVTSGSLSNVSPNNIGNISFIAKIR